MLRSPLAQFDVICIVPVFWGNNEISLTNLSITAFSALLVGLWFLYWFFNGYLVPRNVFKFIFILFMLMNTLMFLKKIILNKKNNVKNYVYNAGWDHPRCIEEVHPNFFTLGKSDNKYILVQGFYTHNSRNMIAEQISFDKNKREMFAPLEKIEYTFINNKEQAKDLADEIEFNLNEWKNLSIDDDKLAENIAEIIIIHLWDKDKLHVTELNNIKQTSEQFLSQLRNLDFDNKD